MIIKGCLEQISQGTVVEGEFNKIEFIKVDGKRYQNLKYDNYIATALAGALRDEGTVSISINEPSKIIVAVKRENGEVSRTKLFGRFVFTLVFYGIICYGIGGGILSIISGAFLVSYFRLHDISYIWLMIIAVVLLGGILTIKKISKFLYDKNIFGEDT